MSSRVGRRFCHSLMIGIFPLSGIGSNPFLSNARRAGPVHLGSQGRCWEPAPFLGVPVENGTTELLAAVRLMVGHPLKPSTAMEFQRRQAFGPRWGRGGQKVGDGRVDRARRPGSTKNPM